MKQPILTKVCGMTDGENIRRIEALDVDLMGFIFFEMSSRSVQDIPNYLPSKAKRVGVFVNDTLSRIMQKTKDFSLDYIQLHGQESPADCRMIGQQIALPIIKAFQVAFVDDFSRCNDYEDCCHLFLFDTKCSTMGGSGKQFDWSLLEHYKGHTPFLLSGGIGPDSIPALKSFNHPLCIGIDLNSRFELVPGIKNVSLLHDFIQNLKMT